MKIYTKEKYIICFGNGPGGEEVTDEYFKKLLDMLSKKPESKQDIGYRLTVDLEWESFIPKPDEKDGGK